MPHRKALPPAPADPSAYRFLFGPVASRRLGRSLGVDLVPFKTCSYDCIYCQLGPTAAHSLERREWVPTHEVIAEIRRWLDSDGRADIITLAGSGEPTLHCRFGEVLEAIRGACAIRTALLTNGSLLHLAEVRRDAARAHLVKVTFSAPDEATWRRIHRPVEGLRHSHAIEALRRFRQEFTGELWLEVMLVAQVNAAPDKVRALASLAATIGADRVQLNTPVRPPSDAGVRPLERRELEALAGLFTPPAEVVGEWRAPHADHAPAAAAEAILGMISRHPASAEEIASDFGLHLQEVEKQLAELVAAGRARTLPHGAVVFYVAAARE